jgi:FkbM family methyltransferase
MKNYYRLWRNHSHPWRFLMARVLMLSGISRWILISQENYSLKFSNSNIAMYRWIDPHEKDDELSFYRAYLKPGDTVVDVGANIGETVLTSSIAVGATGRVIAFEPHPRIFDYFQDNLRLNKIQNVKSFNLALGAAPSEVAFTDDRRDDMNRVSSNGCGLAVALDTLDRLLLDYPRIQLLKVDVEGYEKFVLLGGRESILRTACIYFEVSAIHFERYAYTTADLMDIVSNFGFRIFRIERLRLLSPVARDFIPVRYENLVALRDPLDFSRRSGWEIRI